MLLACVCSYVAYKVIYLPNKIRATLKKYSNVYIAPNATFLDGDTRDVFAGQHEDKRHIFSRFEGAVLRSPEKYDMYLLTAGSFVALSLCSVEAMDEFKNSVPHDFDRADSQKENLAKLALKALTFLPSNENWNRRRKYMMSKIGIQQVSKKIPLILNSLNERFGNLEVG